MHRHFSILPRVIQDKLDLALYVPFASMVTSYLNVFVDLFDVHY